MAKEVSKTCRTCLGNNVELVSIYNGDDNSVVEMLEYILDRQLEVTDELPQKVCHECFNDISRCYSFKTKCNNSFKILRNLLGKRKHFPEVVMQIKVESEVNNSGELFEAENDSQKSLDVSGQNLTIGEITVKSELTEATSVSDLNNMTVQVFDKNNSVRQINRNEMIADELQLYEKEIVPPATIALSSNNEVNSGHYEYSQEQNNTMDIHTVQYLIRELKEEQDSVDELLEVEVNIRHCASCGSGFAQEMDFNKHMKICGRNKQINLMQRSQNKYKKHLCPYCDKAFPRPCRLKNHLRKHHQEIVASKLKEPAQTQCDFSYNLESSLKYHLSSHTKETQFNRFFCEENLNRYLPNNTIPKKHKCKECHQEFELSSQLKLHMLYHKAKRFFVCRLCQKQFVREEEFKMHSVLVHNDKKPFKCKFCATGFTEKYSLIYHQQKYLCTSK